MNFCLRFNAFFGPVELLLCIRAGEAEAFVVWKNWRHYALRVMLKRLILGIFEKNHLFLSVLSAICSKYLTNGLRWRNNFFVNSFLVFTAPAINLTFYVTKFKMWHFCFWCYSMCGIHLGIPSETLDITLEIFLVLDIYFSCNSKLPCVMWYNRTPLHLFLKKKLSMTSLIKY